MSQDTITQPDVAAFDDASAFDEGFDVTFTGSHDDGDFSGDYSDQAGPGTAVTALPAPSTVQLLDMTEPLTMDEARELTEHIRSASEVVYVLISRAHAGRAWEALGYDSWEKYVRVEFDISRSRSYQLLNQATIINAIEGAVPDGTDFTISEAAARDLRSIIGDIVPEIADATYNLPATEAGEVVEELVGKYRDEIRERKAGQDEAAAEHADEGYTPSSSPGNGTWTPPPVLDEDDDMADSAAVRRNFQAVYDLYSSLSALKGMPGIADVINTIPPERRIQVNANIPNALAWLQEFNDTWFAQPFQQESTPAEEDEYDDFETTASM